MGSIRANFGTVTYADYRTDFQPTQNALTNNYRKATLILKLNDHQVV